MEYFMISMAAVQQGKKYANVYHAMKFDDQEMAIKVYKTSVLVFKDRDQYVQGDYRFRYGYCRHNPRKMVKTWAEKEMRNLLRLKAAGIRCPTPLVLRLHVLVMEFIGKADWAAPRLKDAALSIDKLREVYLEMIMAMRTLYQKCKLVHGDLSEYNILYFEVQQKILDRGDMISQEDEIADSVFVQAFIPKTLDHVKNVEEDIDRITSGKDTGDIYYQTISGLKQALSMTQPQDSAADLSGHCNLHDSETEAGTDTDDENEENLSDSEGQGSAPENETRAPADKRAARKENKKKVKEDKREARKTKVPKAVKKKQRKLAKAK